MMLETLYRQALAAPPDEETPKLVLADWLEAHGHPANAELVRLQLARARTPDDLSLRAREYELSEQVASALAGARLEVPDLAAGGRSTEVRPRWTLEAGFVSKVSFSPMFMYGAITEPEALPEGPWALLYEHPFLRELGTGFVRGPDFDEDWPSFTEILESLLREPLVERLEGLSLYRVDMSDEPSEILQTLLQGAWPSLRTLELLYSRGPSPLGHQDDQELAIEDLRVLARVRPQALERVLFGGDRGVFDGEGRDRWLDTLDLARELGNFGLTDVLEGLEGLEMLLQRRVPGYVRGW
jgi:uncharacterized protein (TIGR02996 family)